jgi:hypothetical protein
MMMNHPIVIGRVILIMLPSALNGTYTRNSARGW